MIYETKVCFGKEGRVCVTSQSFPVEFDRTILRDTVLTAAEQEKCLDAWHTIETDAPSVVLAMLKLGWHVGFAVRPPDPPPPSAVH